MSNENEVDEKLRAMLTAAAFFFDAAQRAYREQQPEGHAAYCAVVERGGAQPYVTITMPPALSVEVGAVRGEQREAFFAWPASHGRPN